MDFAKEDSASYIPRLEEAVKDLDIGVLVNNVGMSYDYPQEFLELDSTYVDSLINVNITSLNTLTRIVLPQMVERKNGAIINIASLSCAMPTPLLTVYASAKSYVDKFSSGLAKEYENKGITVQCILPGHVVSNMSKMKRSSLAVPKPEAFVASALARLGIDSRTTGFWAHDIMNFAVEHFPEFLIVNIVFNQMKGIKARALKKKQKTN